LTSSTRCCFYDCCCAER